MDLHGCSAVVTGGSGGLGLATVAELARAGCFPVALDLPSPAAAAALAALGDRAGFAGGDVCVEDDVSRALDMAQAAGPLGLVVNCAGIADPGRILGRDGPLPLAAFERVVRVNLVGTFNVIRLTAERMAANDPVDGERGVIITTASVAAFEGQVGQAAYAASKGAVAALTLPAARELARFLIRVVTIAPGLFRTPMLAGLPEDAQQSLAAQVPHPARLGDPGEYAALVRHIAENPMLNGEVIRLDGALRMGPR